jgi:hypothetical protein
MVFAGVSYLAIFCAAVASWVFGAIWYMVLAKPWMAAQGWVNKEEMLGPGGKSSPVPFVIAFMAGCSPASSATWAR